MTDRHPGRLSGLDGLRGVAATWVMLFHYTAWYPFLRTGEPQRSGLLVWFPNGIFGVELFFVISGFVIFMTLERAPSLADFATARFARLYPAFLAAMLATIVLTAAPFDLARLAANLTMVPLVLGQLPFDGSYWTLQYELDFYLLAALVVLVFRWREPELPCAVWLLVELLLRGWIGALPRGPLMNATHTSFAHLFVIGIMLYRLHARQATRLTLPLLALAIVLSLYGPHFAFRPMVRLEYMGFVAGFALLVWLASTRYGRFLCIGPLRFLGRISYPLYLVHQAVGFALLDRLSGLDPNLAVAITLAGAIVLAWAISAAVEWPARRWLLERMRHHERVGPGHSRPHLPAEPVGPAQAGGGRAQGG